MLKINLYLENEDYLLMKNKCKGDTYYDLNFFAEKMLFKKTKLKMEDIQQNIIPIIESDVFISYSHKDMEQAKILAETLQYHEFFTFVDCYYWKSIDSALKNYDDLYCKNSHGGYDYNERNYSTASFHMILADSIIDVVKKAKVFIKLKSNNYTDSNGRTNSPWIYLECKVAKSCESDKIKHRVIIHDALNESRISFKTPDDLGFYNIYSIKELIDVLNKYFYK